MNAVVGSRSSVPFLLSAAFRFCAVFYYALHSLAVKAAPSVRR